VKLEQKLDEAKAKPTYCLPGTAGAALGKAARAQTAMVTIQTPPRSTALKDRCIHTRRLPRGSRTPHGRSVERLTRLDRGRRGRSATRNLKCGVAAATVIRPPSKVRVTGVIMNCNYQKAEVFIPAEIPKACSRPIPSTSSETSLTRRSGDRSSPAFLQPELESGSLRTTEKQGAHHPI